MDSLLVERADGVVTVTLNRPEKKNAADPGMVRDLAALLREIGTTASDRAVVLTGAGGAFCSGADLTSAESFADAGLGGMRSLGELVLALHRLPKPTMAKVRGVAVGAGCNLALGCDLVVASDTARFSEIFSRRGLVIDGGGSWLLPRLIGLHRAKELALLGEMLTAEDAVAIGLVNRVVPDAELDGVVGELARRLAAGPPLALSMTKALLNQSGSVSMAEAVEAEGVAQTLCFRTADAAEALQAFYEKRDPTFTGA